MSNVKKIYQDAMPCGGFSLNEQLSLTKEGCYCYSLSPERGEGNFWNYFYKDMFVIDKQDFRFSEDFFLEMPEPDFFAVQYFFSVSGEELSPYQRLSPNLLRFHAGGNGKTYRAVYRKNTPVRSVSISIFPDFYRNYLREKLDGKAIDPALAFQGMRLGTDFPALIVLLKQIHAYSGTGISAKLFYEGKVLEALALILDRAKEKQVRRKSFSISKADEETLLSVANYLDHHFNSYLPSECLCRIACMSHTRLKIKFREYFGCSIRDYILQKKMNQAQQLLTGTELSIGEIARTVGYHRSESFARQFQKSTGFLPKEYRKTLL